MQARGHRGNRALAPRGRYTPRQMFVREPRKLPPALGPEIRQLVHGDISTDLHGALAEITDCELIASYNLMDNLSKKILVPGRPALWTPSSAHMKLNADSGDYYRDENAARFPDYTLEPVVRSIFVMNPRFDAGTVDLMACGSTLGNLIRFAKGIGEPFSFVVQIIGQTALFMRRELSPTELIENVHGFGHAFVEANTTWSKDVKGSSSHQRIISYLLGGMKVLVRFEADGYTMDQVEDFEASEDAGGVPVALPSIEDDLANLLHRQEPAASTGHATVISKGGRTAQSSTIDIKTRSARKLREDVLDEQLPRLWVRQVDNIVLSFHHGGVFEPAAVENISQKILAWEEKNQTAIARLINLIDMIKSAAAQHPGRKLEVRSGEPETLQFHDLSTSEQTKWHAVPEDLCKRWAGE